MGFLLIGRFCRCCFTYLTALQSMMIYAFNVETKKWMYLAAFNDVKFPYKISNFKPNEVQRVSE